tara:strand:- start:3846 stop:4583 length:738 start_codon:yes stop_codon:yes gene_type:complete
MWVTYFENLLNDSAFYRTYSQLLEKRELDGELNYVIENPSFEKSCESSLFKVYSNNDHGFTCYCSPESKSVKALGEILSNSLGKAEGKIPINFKLNKKPLLNEYDNLGVANINAQLNRSVKLLCSQLLDTGIFVKKFQVKKSGIVLIEIESSSFLDLISDIEFTRFFCLNFFVSDYCSIAPITKRDSNLLGFSIKVSRKLKANEKKKLSKIENLSLSEDKIEVENLGSNSSVLQQIISVVSQISP